MITFQPSQTLAICSDLFNTMFDFAWVSHEERKMYADHIKQEWTPFNPPTSWLKLKPFSDTSEGIKELRKHVKFYTFSNAPYNFTYDLLGLNGIEVDGVLSLEEYKVFKPNRRAYIEAVMQLGLRAEECLMVSANKDFGDIEKSRTIGMQSQLLVRPGMNYIDLAKVFAEL